MSQCQKKDQITVPEFFSFGYRKVASSRLSQLVAHFQTVYEWMF